MLPPTETLKPTKWLDLLWRRAENLAFLGHCWALHDENLVEGARSRQHVIADGIGRLQDLLHVSLAADGRIRRAEDVAADVSANGNAVHAGLVGCPHARNEVLLEEAVHLHGLPIRHLHCAVGVLLAKVIKDDELLSTHVATRKAKADHVAHGVFDAKLLALPAQISVVLHVSSMALQQEEVAARNCTSRVISQGLVDCAAQLAGLRLHSLRARWRRRGSASSSSCCRCVDTQGRIQLSFERAETLVVGVLVLVVSEASGDQALTAALCENGVKIPSWLGEVLL